MATSVLSATEVPLWRAGAGDGGKYSCSLRQARTRGPQLFTVQWSQSHMEEGNESTLPFGHSVYVSTLVLHQAVDKCELLSG